MAYADQAADLFQKASSADTAFNTLTRAAKHAEGTRPEAAIQFYTKAADLYKMEGGRIREAADVLGRVRAPNLCPITCYFDTLGRLPANSTRENARVFDNGGKRARPTC